MRVYGFMQTASIPFTPPHTQCRLHTQRTNDQAQSQALQQTLTIKVKTISVYYYVMYILLRECFIWWPWRHIHLCDLYRFGTSHATHWHFCQWGEWNLSKYTKRAKYTFSKGEANTFAWEQQSLCLQFKCMINPCVFLQEIRINLGEGILLTGSLLYILDFWY